MSRTEALARAQVLRTALLDHGVRSVSIELQQGRPGTPNDQWWDDRFVMEMSHHTVSRPSQGDTPCLALVKRGRSDVPGPLCNGYGGYDLVYRIICMGWANHPGAGGPLTIAGFRIPENTARPYAWGTEYEGGLEPWTDEFREFMGRSNAGILDWLDRPIDAHGEHKTWAPDRKIDRLGYTTTSGRAEVTRWAGAIATEPEDEMTPDQLLAALKNPDVAQELKNITAGAWRGPTIRDAFGDYAAAQLNVDRGTYGFGSENQIKLGDGGAHRYAWGAYTVAVRIEAAVKALAEQAGTPVDLGPIEDLTREVGSLADELASSRSESAALRQLLQQVADGQVTPASLAEELAARLES